MILRLSPKNFYSVAGQLQPGVHSALVAGGIDTKKVITVLQRVPSVTSAKGKVTTQHSAGRRPQPLPLRTS